MSSEKASPPQRDASADSKTDSAEQPEERDPLRQVFGLGGYGMNRDSEVPTDVHARVVQENMELKSTVVRLARQLDVECQQAEELSACLDTMHERYDLKVAELAMAEVDAKRPADNQAYESLSKELNAEVMRLREDSRRLNALLLERNDQLADAVNEVSALREQLDKALKANPPRVYTGE